MRLPRRLARCLVFLTASCVVATTSTACFLFDAQPSPTPVAMTATTATTISEMMGHGKKTAATTTTTAPQASAPKATSDQDKLGTKPKGDAQAGEAGATARGPVGPAPFDAAVFVGKGSAGTRPDGFLSYPKTLEREELPSLGRVDRDDDDDEGAARLDTVYPTDAMYERARVFFARGATTPSSITIRFYASNDPKRALLDLRAALEKRYGKGKLRPDGATDEDFDRVLWQSPRMRLALDESNVEIELMY